MDSSFPSKNFPYDICPHGRKRDLLFGYGTIGQVDVDDCSDVISKCTRDKRDNRLRATHAILPLSPLPAAKQPWTDNIMGTNVSQYESSKKYITGLTSRLNAKHYAAEKKKKILTQIEANTGKGIVNVPWLKDYIDDFTQIPIHGSTDILPFNSFYTGGCVGYLPCSTNGCVANLISTGDKNFNTLKIQSLWKTAEKGILHSEIISTIAAPEPIFEVKCKQVQLKNICVVRCSSSCALYTAVGGEEEDLTLAYTTNKWLKPTSIDISDYIQGECVISTMKEKGFLWTEKGLVKVISPVSPRCATSDLWCHLQFGSHPRQLIYADPSQVLTFDIRTQSKSSSVELMVAGAPNKFLHENERFSIATRHPANPFYHVLATDVSLIIMDERFPKYPVLHWAHSLLNVPKYMKGLSRPGTSEEEHSIFVGSQLPPEVHCFTFDKKGNNAARLMRDPWRAARIDDIANWQCYTNGYNQDEVKERFHTSLAGFEVIPLSDGLAVLQMDSLGEVFYQVYTDSVENTDLTLAVNLKEEIEVPSSADIELCRRWIGQLDSKMLNTEAKVDDKACLRNTHATFRDICDKPPFHIDCGLCMGIPLEVEEMEEKRAQVVCPACLYPVRISQMLLQSTNQEIPQLPSDPKDENLLESQLPKVSALPTNSTLSLLLMKHWEKDDNITDLLKQKDKEVKKLNRVRLKNKLILDKMNKRKKKPKEEMLKEIIQKIKAGIPVDTGKKDTEDSEPESDTEPIVPSSTPASADVVDSQAVSELNLIFNASDNDIDFEEINDDSLNIFSQTHYSMSQTQDFT